MTVEEVFSARQAADRLGLSSAMTRRYGAALEQLTGEPIRQHPRDGRQYRREQLEMMQRAKSFVEANPRLSVAQALQLALGEAPEVATPAVTGMPGIPSEALSMAFSEALERTLLPEVRALREEVAALKSRALPPGANAERIDRALEVEVREDRAPPEQSPTSEDSGAEAERPGDGPDTSDGLLVRAARWVERRLRR